MASKKETYPEVGDPDRLGAYYLILDQYRQSIAAGAPLPIEWLSDSIRDGVLKDIVDYQSDLRHALKDLAVAEAIAETEREKPVLIGEEPEPVEEPVIEPESPADDPAVEAEAEAPA
jgi:hypothetical protein